MQRAYSGGSAARSHRRARCSSAAHCAVDREARLLVVLGGGVRVGLVGVAMRVVAALTKDPGRRGGQGPGSSGRGDRVEPGVQGVSGDVL